LSGQQSVLAISEWAARQPATMLTSLGFSGRETPRQPTLQRLFVKLDAQQLSRVLSGVIGSVAISDDPTLDGVAIDGKAQRGRLRFDTGGCPVHALSAVCHRTGLVLAHEAVDVDRETDRAEAELTVAPDLIAQIDWRNRVLTGDALYCQRSLCQQVLAAGGDYLLTVKHNQPQLFADIQLLFDPPPDLRTLPLHDCRRAETIESGHGRTQDRRILTVSTDLAGYLDWPGHAQVLRIERTWIAHQHHHRSLSYAITSLPPDRADAAQLLALKRGHWIIENRLHRCKDVNLGEDASLIHTGSGPQIMTLVRDAAIDLLHAVGVHQIAARLRRHAQHPEEAVALVLGALTTHV
ncbi:MAG: ISAs1 family transposase, partial [Planctomycetaceae bacterium]|nr:ISAs1 family transposase [Planctomycetaceae bacterium]